VHMVLFLEWLAFFWTLRVLLFFVSYRIVPPKLVLKKKRCDSTPLGERSTPHRQRNAAVALVGRDLPGSVPFDTKEERSIAEAARRGLFNIAHFEAAPVPLLKC
jgi:hypothetical protein